MSYLALARKYRPSDFDHILSQHHITTTLKNAVKSGRVSHAYLFCGPRGTGKTTTARVLAKALNCQKGPTPSPCNNCTSCKEITIGSSPDVFEIDAASNRGIDDIRELRENVRYAPVGGRYKIYIVDEVHRLTKEAFDALLKTLEEPPTHVIFVFATTDPQTLPPTILSRTQRYDFKRIPVTSLAEAVSSVAQKENISIDATAALLLAKKADGSLRDALSLLDQLSSFSEETISVKEASEVLGLVQTEILAKISSSIINRNPKEALDIFAEFAANGGDPQELSEALSGYMRTLILVKNGVLDHDLLELDNSEIEMAKQISAEIDSVDLLRHFTVLADYKNAIKQGQDPVFSFEISLVKMALTDRAVSLESLLKSFKAAQTPNQQSRTDTYEYPHHFKADSNLGSGKIKSFKQQTCSEHDQSTDSQNTVSKSRSSKSLTLEHILAEWGNFCTSVGKINKTVFAYLGVCKPTEFENSVLTLSIENANGFHLQQLSKTDKKELVESLLEKFFGEKIKLAFKQDSSSQKQESEQKENNSLPETFENSPEAKKLFDLLDGKIIGQ